MGSKFLRVFVAALLLAALPALGQAQQYLTILHTNDTHSAMVPFGPGNAYGGIARMARLIKSFKTPGRRVLTLNAGDVFVGSFEFNKYLGYPELKIMQNLYDAMSLGNHELDLGLNTLAGVLSGAIAGDAAITLPVLCANIDLSGHPGLQPFVMASMVKTLGGLKVGITAVLNTDAQNYSPDVAALLTDPYAAAATQAADLRGQGCQVVVCISHLGRLYDLMGLASVPGIDIIVGGHSHDALKKPFLADGKIIVQAGEFGRWLGELKVKYATGKVSFVSYILHPVNASVPSDPAVAQAVNLLKLGIESDPRFGPVFTKKIGWATNTLEETWLGSDPRRDTAVGNLVTDGIKSGVQSAGHFTDLALEAMGYTAYKIFKGKIVGNDVLRAVPYGYDPVSGLGFKVMVVLLAGQQILAGLEYSVSKAEYVDDLSLQASGISYAYDSSKPPAPLGELSRIDPASVLVNGAPINPMGTYWVAINEALYNMLVTLGLTPYATIDTGLFEYNLVRDFVKSLSAVNYAPEGRIIDRALE